jgi:hypothetical protein
MLAGQTVEQPGNLARRQNVIGIGPPHGMARHVGIGRFLRVLDDRHTPAIPHRTKAGRAVVEDARQQDTGHTFAVFGGGGAEQGVDRRPVPVRFPLQAEVVPAYDRLQTWRRDVDVARPDRFCFLRSAHRQEARSSEDLYEGARSLRG